MNVVVRKISDLVFDPINARKHGGKNIDAIKGSLTKFGQQKPIIINNKGIVIAGNGTLAAAKELGWSDIKCVVSELDDLNQMAFALADNRTAELAEWDMDILSQQLAQLELNEFEIEDIGFDSLDVNSTDNIEDIDIVEDPKTENEIKIVCSNYDDRIEAIEILGGKKILWEDLKKRLKK